MFICPNCNIALKTIKSDKGVFWLCTSCDGRSATLALLRKDIPAITVNEMWQSAKSGNFPRRRDCPACLKKMAEVPILVESGKQNLDVCTVCQFIWFDYGEFATLPRIPVVSKVENTLPEEARLKMALFKIEQIKVDARRKDFSDNTPEEGWQWIPGILGMPIEVDSQVFKSRSHVTWGLASLIIFVSVIAFFDLKNMISSFGLIPENFGRYLGLTFITSFLLHGGIFHLISNMYFFLVFGDNVEDFLGKKRFLILLFAAAFVGDIAHIIGDIHSIIPCVGASGGISGVLAFYALKFPHANLGICVNRRWICLPAYDIFFIWIVLQLICVYKQLHGLSNISALAHLGGVCVGVIFWFLNRKD
jgi:membrane associated rhomboid family serine protease/Zn-finger nucleic acid-binding protein